MSLVPRQHVDADVAVVGSGFGGSLTAQALRRLGHSVVLVERGSHPRFVIGESSTPLANLLLEEIADRYGLPAVRPLSKWGTWRRAYPHVACGLKRGFTFYHHRAGEPFEDDVEHRRQLLVAASARDEAADTHWYRPDVDCFLVEHAVELGCTYLDETAIGAVRLGDRAHTLEARRHGADIHIRCRFVVDATGPRGFLHGALGLATSPLRWLPATQALYAHFTGVERWDRLHRDAEVPPYPVDDAAVHHVFPGGWIWVLRFANGITSAGAAVTDALAADLRLADREAAWTRLLQRLPSVARQFAGATPVTPFFHLPRLAFRSARAAGPGWALLPSAAGVIDPLLSTGFPLTLLGVVRLVEIVDRRLRGEPVDQHLADYEAQTLRELDATERLVGALYASMDDFALFKKLSLLYFAAASYSETARRLGRRDRARSFLLCDDPRFGPAAAAATEGALARPEGPVRTALCSAIDAAIAPFDLEGFGDRSRRDWYGVRLEDLIAGAPKLGATEAEVRALVPPGTPHAAERQPAAPQEVRS